MDRCTFVQITYSMQLRRKTEQSVTKFIYLIGKTCANEQNVYSIDLRTSLQIAYYMQHKIELDLNGFS